MLAFQSTTEAQRKAYHVLVSEYLCYVVSVCTNLHTQLPFGSCVSSTTVQSDKGGGEDGVRGRSVEF